MTTFTLTWIQIVGQDSASFLFGGRDGEGPDAGENIIHHNSVGKTFHHSFVLRGQAGIPVDFAEIQLETAVAFFGHRFQIGLSRQNLEG